MKTVKRYDQWQPTDSQGFPNMEESDTGEWVAWDDFNEATATIASLTDTANQLRLENEEMKELLERLIKASVCMFDSDKVLHDLSFNRIAQVASDAEAFLSSNHNQPRP